MYFSFVITSWRYVTMIAKIITKDSIINQDLDMDTQQKMDEWMEKLTN